MFVSKTPMARTKLDKSHSLPPSLFSLFFFVMLLLDVCCTPPSPFAGRAKGAQRSSTRSRQSRAAGGPRKSRRRSGRGGRGARREGRSLGSGARRAPGAVCAHQRRKRRRRRRRPQWWWPWRCSLPQRPRSPVRRWWRQRGQGS